MRAAISSAVAMLAHNAFVAPVAALGVFIATAAFQTMFLRRARA